MRNWRLEFVVSLASGLVLAGAAKATAGLSGERVPTWLFVAVLPVGVVAGNLSARLTHRGRQRVFVLVSALAQTRWLASVLAEFVRVLERHDIDVIVKLPEYDHSGQAQLRQLTTLRSRRRDYIGGFVVIVEPERIQRELAEFCTTAGFPLVFLDVPPFPTTDLYPAGSTFVGFDAAKIGRDAGGWVADKLTEEGLTRRPTVLVVAGEAQTDRQAGFQAVLRERIPSVQLTVDTRGMFIRHRARGIVQSRLRQLNHRGEYLDAIFCTNDEMALGALDAIQECAASGLARTPILVGVDGIPEATAAIEAVNSAFQATLVQDPRRIADIAVDLLLRLADGQHLPSEHSISAAVHPIGP
jgi:ribose transport system substrate-binding protein